jgi:ubiquitin carboxyl-terminal hydrolase 4/11/15
LLDTSVTKQKDTARVVTSAAYLLFYRRRSHVPLGGPKFQEIFDRYNHGPDDDISDSGEGQRLGQGSSSQRGSPSASTGAGPTLPRGGRGWDRRAEEFEQRSYPDYETDLAPWNNGTALHSSIEVDAEDEGIGLTDYDTAGMAAMTSVIGPSNWSFDNLANASKAGSDAADDDIASDVAQNDGSSVNGDDDGLDLDGSDRDRDMESLLQREPGADYVEPPEPTPNGFADGYDVQPPPPSAEDQEYINQIAARTWVKQQIHTVPPADGLGGGEDDDLASDKVAEIHVGDADEQAPAAAAAATGEKPHA